MKISFFTDSKFAFILGISMIMPALAAGQDNGPRGNDPYVRVVSAQTTKISKTMNVDMVVDHDPLLLTRNERFVVTPMIVKGRDTLEMSPMVFMAKNQLIKENRLDRLYGKPMNFDTPYEKVGYSSKDMRVKKRQLRRNSRTENASRNRINYHNSIMYQPWMEGSQLVLRNEVVGCCEKGDEYYSSLGRVYDPVAPMVTFVVPEVEAVKARSEAMTARVVFQVDKSVIRRDLYDNAAELDSIYSFTNRVVDNRDVNVTDVKLRGYASPEASWKYNDRLSRNRVEALRAHLAERYSFDANSVSISNVPEDWDSLRSWVASSDLRHRNQVLEIIDNTTDPDARDGKIKALDGGETYRYLLTNVYPGLRRVDYEIAYTVVPFTVERGKQVMRTNPQHLSLNELYQIAKTYPEGSPEFEEVFAIAARNFPNDPVANNNMAAIALKKGDLPTARRYMEKVGNMPFAQNNLGILYILEENYESGSEILRQTAESGNAEAAYNYKNVYLLR